MYSLKIYAKLIIKSTKKVFKNIFKVLNYQGNGHQTDFKEQGLATPTSGKVYNFFVPLLKQG